MQSEVQNAAPASHIALLPPAERAVIVLESSKTEAQLRELVQQSSDIIEVKDKAGRDQAHRAGMNLKNVRVAIEKTGKAARDDANAFNKAVIAEEKRLIGIAQPEEDRILSLRDKYDAEQARIKAEEERKEIERKARIQGQIAAIRNIPVALAGACADDLATEIADLEAFQAGEEFGEFSADADAAALTAIATLRGMHVRQVAAEAEAARVAAERAELERMRAEQEKRDREAAELRAAEAAKLQAERDAIAAERRALEEQKAAAAREAEAKKAAAITSATDEEIAGVAHYHQGQVIIPADKPVAELEIAPVFLALHSAEQAPAGDGFVALQSTSMTIDAVTIMNTGETFAIDPVITAELTDNTAADGLAVEGFRLMVAELYVTRSADAIRELLETVLADLEGKKVAE